MTTRKATPPKVTPKKPIKIIIGQRGWVWVGRVTKTGSEIKITSAKCIRQWGTSRGLGELVDGPLRGTQLDPVGVLRLHILGAVAIYDVNQEAWNAALG